MNYIDIDGTIDNLTNRLLAIPTKYIVAGSIGLVVLALFIVSGDEEDENIYVNHYYHAAVVVEHFCDSSGYCGPRPWVPGEVPVTFKVAEPVDLKLIAVDGRTWATFTESRTKDSWVVGRNSHLTIWVPETWLQANMKVCEGVGMTSCATLESGVDFYELPSAA